MLSLSKHEAAQTYDFICRAVLQPNNAGNP